MPQPPAPRPWGRPHPAVAAVRQAVRAVLTEVGEAGEDDLVLVACSGGADSLALADAAAHLARTGALGAVRVGAVVIDHGLQEASSVAAATAAQQCRELRLDPVELVVANVRPGADGLEAAARTARYAALEAAADRLGAGLVLLGHTLDDQAEQVLLGLARGSGARSLAGMPPARGRYRRPLLGLTRAQTRAACVAEGLAWWEDPMNADESYARVRARRALADLEADLGPGLAQALARSADLLRADADHLEEEAEAAYRRLVGMAGEGAGPPKAPFGDCSTLPVVPFGDLPVAVRTRVWRLALMAVGAPAGRLSAGHVAACDRLLTQWHGQGPLDLPGPVSVARRAGWVYLGGPMSERMGLAPPATIDQE